MMAMVFHILSREPRLRRSETSRRIEDSAITADAGASYDSESEKRCEEVLRDLIYSQTPPSANAASGKSAADTETAELLRFGRH